MQRLVQLQPSVQFISSNPRNTAINIRGIGAPFGLTNDGIQQGVGLYIDHGGWEVFGWVRNAFDTAYFDFLTAAPGSTGLIVGQPGDPRTWGVTASVRF